MMDYLTQDVHSEPIFLIFIYAEVLLLDSSEFINDSSASVQCEAAPDVLLFPNEVLNNFLTANILVLIHDTGK